MAYSMEQILSTLQSAFEEAAQKHSLYDDPRDAYSNQNNNLKIQNRMALAQLAQAIVAVEARIETQQEKGNELKKGLG